MAYDKIITIRARLDDCLRYVQDGEKTALSLALDYIEDSGKTTLDDEVILQSAINCTLETCYQDMQHTKERFGKPGGVVGYHLVHSYAPGETTPELAHEAGVEFARRLLGDKYEAVICTHINKEHLHCHSLGENYTEEAILQRLRRQRGVTAAIPPEQSESKRYTIRKQPRRYLPVKRGSFRALYLYYLYLLSPRKRKPQKIPFETRAEIRRAKQYRQQFFLLQKYHIDTKPELDMLSDALTNEMQIIVDRRKELYALRREQPSEQLDADIDALTAQLRPLRRELRLCGKIAEYSPRMLRQVQESNSPSTENHAPDKARERRHSLWR